MTDPAVAAEVAEGLRRLPGHPAAYFGPGGATRLTVALRGLAARRVLLVHGRRSFAQCGAAPSVTAACAGLQVERYTAFRPNPELTDVLAGVELARRLRPDVVVGVGGGSAMDVAKLIAFLTCREAPRPGEGGRLEAPGDGDRTTSLVLLPTTAGSGAELTRFATVYHRGRKYSLDDAWVRADLVLVDPDLTASAPPQVAIAAGLDALCQAIESAWSVQATGASRQLAGDALTVLLPALAEVSDGAGCGADPLRRSRLALGAALSGAAIDVTRTTAAHALSYPLTIGLGVPHGAAVALHLRWLAGHHAGATATDCRHPDGPAAAAALVTGLRDRVDAVTGRPLEALLARLLALAGQPSGLHELRLDARDWFAPLAAELTSGRAAGSPRVVTHDDLRTHVFSYGRDTARD